MRSRRRSPAASGAGLCGSLFSFLPCSLISAPSAFLRLRSGQASAVNLFRLLLPTASADCQLPTAYCQLPLTPSPFHPLSLSPPPLLPLSPYLPSTPSAPSAISLFPCIFHMLLHSTFNILQFPLCALCAFAVPSFPPSRAPGAPCERQGIVAVCNLHPQ